MTAEEIRRAFLDFFAEKGHKIVPSAPIVVKNDPTLLFTNAGMNQFKDYFLGNKKAEHTRVADTQKCLRVSGKHNDLEEVGIDTYHHTMFEMLGNWSFGDYFKKEAISWAWELLTERYGMDKSRLYVTIFEGDAKEGLKEDTESLGIWSERVQTDHILRGSKKDNFWEMGDTGPCGPCTEIHFDLRSDEERKAVPGASLVNNDHPQVIEIWNNVFIQYNRKADSSLEQLPDKHVDTGMGFERLVRVLQGKSSNYDTDVFRPLIRKMETDLHFQYGVDDLPAGQAGKKDIAARVIADHVRAVTFTIADGQLPSNTGAGYVIRRILRRAVRYGYTFLGMEQPYIYQLVTVLAQQFKNTFPEVIKQEDFIKKVVQEEEASFLRTLASGTKLFEKHIEALKGDTIEGSFAFELYDTFGFPSDLTQLMARERGLQVDMEGFNAGLQQQKTRSRKASARTEGDWTVLHEEAPMTKFIGYDTLEAEVSIIRYREVSEKSKTAYHIVLDQTPFYPEGGGQVGDTGILKSETETLKVVNTFKENDLIIHVVDKLPADAGATFHAQVDEKKRRATVANHTATHLLHAALRQVLGGHVAQKGSLVHPKGLRFDFSHFSKMTDQEIAKVEKIVNEKIRQNIPLREERAIPFDEAKNRGAMALFGEKYGDKVRVITFDPLYSVELCGGTHAQATGQLGFFRIVSESAIAAGVRRIEAVTGEEAEAMINNQQATINEIREVLKNPKDVVKAIEALREQNKKLEQELEKYKLAETRGLKDELIQKAAPVKDGISLLVEEIETADMDGGKSLAFELRSSLPNGIVLLGARMGDKAGIWLSIPEEIGQKTGLHAGNIIREIAPLMDGGGGGQAAFASAGGKNPKGVKAALEKGKEIVLSKLLDKYERTEPKPSEVSELEVSSRTIKVLQQIINSSISWADNAGTAYHGKRTNSLQTYSLNMLQRIRFNLVGVRDLSPHILNHVGFRVPIYLILRSCLTDYANTYYLFSFVDKQKTDLSIFENELRVINREFFKTARDIIEAEKQNNPEAAKKAEYQLLSNPEYFENNELKSIAQIRANSKSLKFQPNKKWTDTEKFQGLREERKLGLPSDPFYLWKFFSQYEHYSQATDWLYTSKVKTDVEFFNLIMAMGYVLDHQHMLLQCLDINDSLIADFLKVWQLYSEFESSPSEGLADSW